MAVAKVVGQGATAKKYDILSAMMAYALGQDKYTQRRVLRLMALITTRYNWRFDDLTMGHKEIARLWSVDPRTVKREMAVFKSLGWIKVKRQGARGRVSSYGLGFGAILQMTQDSWIKIGPDFEERAGILLPDMTPQPKVVQVDFKKPNSTTEQDGQFIGTWRAVCANLRALDGAVFNNWYCQLRFVSAQNGDLVLEAPNRFVARYVENHLMSSLFATSLQSFPDIRRVVLKIMRS